MALVLDKVLYVFDHFLWLSKDKKNKVKIKTKREIFTVSNILCINLILVMNFFKEFILISYKKFFFFYKIIFHEEASIIFFAIKEVL